MNSITVDVEEYFHAANLEPVAGPARWHALESRVEHSTDRLLSLYSELGLRSTFFVLGTTARRHPELVKRIAAAGHEVASHGYGHRLVRSQSERAFYRDVRKSKLLLEDLTGESVLGYRAPNFSIREDTRWAYDALVRAGYLYDSSLHPIAHPRYGNTHRSIHPERIETNSGPLFELPLSVFQYTFSGSREVRLPCSGGAYWRLFPTALIVALLRNTLARSDNLVCYIHPWEIDSGQPVFRQLSALTRIRHYWGTRSLPKVISRVARLDRTEPLRETLFRLFPDSKREAEQRCHPHQ